MKGALNIAMSFLICCLLSACPFSSAYKLDDSPAVYVDDALLGKWATFVKKPNSTKEEPVKLILGKRSDTEYDITLIGFIKELRPYRIATADSIKGIAFMSIVDGKQFLNISIKSQTYIAELRFKDDKLSVLPLVEHFTAKVIQNNSALRSSVEIHYKTRVHPMFDEDFSLKDMVRVN